MSFLLRLLGLGPGRGPAPGAPESEVVRRSAARLERLEPEAARYVAAFACVLMRVARADLHFSPPEERSLRALLERHTGLSPREAALVADLAHSQLHLDGGTENYLVTRAFRTHSNRAQRRQLLDCLFAVAAADGTISTAESAEIRKIGEELGFRPEELVAYRNRHRDQLAELQRGRRG